MKSPIHFWFLLYLVGLMPLRIAANCVESNNDPNYTKKVVMRSTIVCGGYYSTTFTCEHYLGYGQSMAYYDYQSGQDCYYTYTPESCTWIPAQGPYPNVVDSDAWSTGGMADFYYNQYGASQFDMALWWSPGAHDALLGHALGGRATPNAIDVLRAASRAFDRRTQSTAESHLHSMRRKDQTVADAVTARDNFITTTIAQARTAAEANDVPTALRLLGEALHPVMDYSSPMHTDGNGEPRMWRGLVRDGWGHSPNDTVGNERTQDITQAVFDLEDPIIRSYFVAVFRGTPAATTVFAEGFDPNQVPNVVLPQNPP